MNRDELTALRDAIGVLLTWPPAVRDQVAAWLTPEAALRPGNGLDPQPPPRDGTSVHEAKRFAAPDAAPETRVTPPRQAKVRRPESAFAAKTAEQRLIAAMRDNPGASVDGLAKAAGANRSSTGERLRGLASRGVVTKDSAGHWRLVADLAEEAAAAPLRSRRRRDGGARSRG